MKHKIVILAFSFLYLWACKKDEKTTIEILASHPWKLSAATINPGLVNPANGSVISDLLAILGTCLSDNTYSFTSDGKYVEDEGPTKCDPTDPQTNSGDLNLSADGKTATVDGVVFTFEEISEDKVVYTFNANVNNTAQIVRFTLVKK